MLAVCIGLVGLLLFLLFDCIIRLLLFRFLLLCRVRLFLCCWLLMVDVGSSSDVIVIVLFGGENISFDASLVMYINRTNIPHTMIMNRMYENWKP